MALRRHNRALREQPSRSGRLNRGGLRTDGLARGLRRVDSRHRSHLPGLCRVQRPKRRLRGPDLHESLPVRRGLPRRVRLHLLGGLLRRNTQSNLPQSRPRWPQGLALLVVVLVSQSAAWPGVARRGCSARGLARRRPEAPSGHHHPVSPLALRGVERLVGPRQQRI